MAQAPANVAGSLGLTPKSSLSVTRVHGAIGPWRLVWAGFGEYLNPGFQQNRIGHRAALSLQLQHRPSDALPVAEMRAIMEAGGVCDLSVLGTFPCTERIGSVQPGDRYAEIR